MPLFVEKKRHLYHIGTAFLVSAAGVFATASHCIVDALKSHGLGELEPGRDHDLLNTNVKLSVLHFHNFGEGVRFSIWSVSKMQIAHPSDVAFGSLNSVDAPKAVAPARLSFAVPAPDSVVRAIGYPKNDLPPISLHGAHTNEFDWRSYQPKLMASAGRIKGTVVQEYSIVKGPCLITDCLVEHGMSGGPVVNEAGNVCGIISAGATLEKTKGSVLSLLYPTLPVELKFAISPHAKVTFNSQMPLITAVERGLVKSDGSESLHDIIRVGDQFRVDPRIEKKHINRVYEKTQDFWDNRPLRPRPPLEPPASN